MAELTDTDIRELVRERYAAAATSIAGGGGAIDPMAEPTDASCCGSSATAASATAAGSSCCAPIGLEDAAGDEVFGGSLYEGVAISGRAGPAGRRLT